MIMIIIIIIMHVPQPPHKQQGWKCIHVSCNLSESDCALLSIKDY